MGGIVAGWLGHHATFLVGGGLALFAAGAMVFLMDRAQAHDEAPPRITLRAFAETLANRRFVALLVGAAIPAKLVLGGMLFYLTPLALHAAGAREAEIGRVIMLYGVAGLLTGTLFARLTDRLQRPELALVLGGGLCAAGSLPLIWSASTETVAVAVLALGLGQSLSIPALFTAALALSGQAIARHGQGPVMAILRLFERLGGAAGPLLGAALAAWLGPAPAMAVFGACALLGAAGLALYLAASDRRRHPRRPPPAVDDGAAR
jgi:predicted MFS family arabinose efflux permease